MAMYESLRARLKVKPNFVDLVAELNQYEDWECLVKGDTLLQEYVSLKDCDMIPNGVLSGEPSIWDANSHEFQRSFNRDSRDWVFQCSTANRSGELEYFLFKVIPHIAYVGEYIEHYSEETNTSTIYQLEQGELIENLRVLR